ncbi:MAG: hypothetical protein RLZZ543_1126 [Bacteroidota bacterium]|jgi:bacillithiol system protein YtxJ
MINWLPLESEQQLNELVQLSTTNEVDAVAVFKHSTRCSISTMAKSRLERTWNTGNKRIPIYYLDLLSYRAISNAIATRFGVEHESPQLLLIKNAEVKAHASHTSISNDIIDAL